MLRDVEANVLNRSTNTGGGNGAHSDDGTISDAEEPAAAGPKRSRDNASLLASPLRPKPVIGAAARALNCRVTEPIIQFYGRLLILSESSTLEEIAEDRRVALSERLHDSEVR